MTVHQVPPVKPFRVITCNEWGALPPRGAIVDAGRFDKAIFHHTAGHHPELQPPASGESYGEAVAYARAVQHSHFARGWLDTGNNFLVTRNGYIFEGRHRSLELLGQGHCPVSAHCPGQNGNPGVEHEQLDPERLTTIQTEASAWLFAKICRNGDFGADRIHGHGEYWATDCPGDLQGFLPAFRKLVTAELKPGPPKPPAGGWYRTPIWFTRWAEWWLNGADPAKRPSNVPQEVPQRAFLELDKIGKLYNKAQGG